MIWLSQWVCADRHCSIALLWDDGGETREGIEAQGEAFYNRKVIHRYCGICGGALHLEHALTRFATMEEALPVVEVVQEANLATRRFLEDRRN